MKRAINIIEIPSEHDGAVAVAWRRIQALAFGAPIILDIWKPLLVSIYMQGLMDGVDALERAKASHESEPERTP